MLGVVGDLYLVEVLGGIRVIAWEINSELDLDTLKKEVGYYHPSFEVTATNDGGFLFDLPEFFFHFSNGFLYIDLFTNSIDTITRDEFFKHFKRAY